MKSTQTIALLLTSALFSACATSSATKQGGAINPSVSDVNAHIELGRRTAASAEISTFQIFGLKFHSDVDGKRFSGLRSNLVVPGYSSTATSVSSIPGVALVEGALGSAGTLVSDPLYFLFGSPASRQAALSAARHEAVEKSDADGIIETKAKVDTTGFSLLGIIGWGTATANVEGQGVKIAPGAIFSKSRVLNEKQ
jgi:hypothetical protein